MATQKKTVDPSEAALSAIEEALGMDKLSDPVPGEPATAPSAEAGAPAKSDVTLPEGAKGAPESLTPRLPSVDDLDIFKAQDGENGPITLPPFMKLPDASAKDPAKEAAKAMPEAAINVSKPTTEKADRKSSKANAAPANAEIHASDAALLDAIPKDGRVRKVFPANDDRKADVAELLAPLSDASPRSPLVYATLLSVLWAVGVLWLLLQSDGVLLAADQSLKPGREGVMALGAIGLIVPIVFFFTIATLQRRSRELRVSARVMANVAARLAEPEAQGADAVLTLGQAVRREVSSIGDGIERALTRAGELESLVHGEVTALERSYADNEYKMRSLVTELAAEREAIMATAERIRATIDAAHQGFSADITKASSSISDAIGDAGGRVTFLLSGKQDELVATLEQSTARAADLIEGRTGDLVEKFGLASKEAAELLTATGSSLAADINRNGAEVVGELSRTGDTIASALLETNEALLKTWQSTAENSVHSLTFAASEAANAMQSSSDTFILAMEEKGVQASLAIETKGNDVADLISARAEALASRMIEVSTTIEANLTNGTQLMDEHLGGGSMRLAELLSTHSDEMARSLSSATETLAETLAAKAGHVETRIDESTTRLSQILESHSDIIVTGLTSATDTLAGTLTAKANQVESSLEQGTSRLAQVLESHSGTIVTSLNSASTSIDDALKSHAATLDQNLAERGIALAELISARIDQANEAFSIASESLGSIIVTHTQDATKGLQQEIDALGASLSEQASTATERLAKAGQEVVQAMTGQGLKINEALSSNAARLAEAVHERTASLSDRFEAFEQTFSAKSTSLEEIVMVRGEALSEKFADRANTVSANLESLINRVELGLDTRAKNFGDTVALRTLEFSRVVGESGTGLLNSMEAKVDQFNNQVVNRLAEQVSNLERTTEDATNRIGTRIDQTADAMVSRANEIERAVSSLSTEFNQNGTALVAKLEESSADMTLRVTQSLNELNEAINTGSALSLGRLVEANDRLRTEVTSLLGRLGDANTLLNSIVGTATNNLTQVESQLSDRVRGLEGTLGSILSAASEGSDALIAKVEAIRSASGEVLRHSDGISRGLETQTSDMRNLAAQLTASQAAVSQLLSDRQASMESLAATFNTRIEDMDSMLRSFASLVDEQLNNAQAKAREASMLVNETAETTATAIETQFDRVRVEAGKERERTAAALRSAYDQANTEMTTLLGRSVEGFTATAAQLRQASAEMIADLEATRQALAQGALEIPKEARDATTSLKRVVTDQVRALNELTDIVSRSSRGLDVAEPRRAEPEAAPARLAVRAPEPAPRAAEPAPRVEAPRARPAPTQPRPAPQQGGSWLSGLLERASDEDSPLPPLTRNARGEAPPVNTIESLDSLSVDIARMIDHEAAVELWDRYRKGERNVFTRRLYTIQGQEAYDDIRRRYRRDTEFRKTVDAYVGQFERLLNEVAGDDRDSMVARTYLTSETGKVYTMLAHAAGRFD